MNNEDIEIVRKIKRGDSLAFEKLLIKYDKKVYGFINKIVKDEYIAQDLAQETFIKVYENIYKFDVKKTFITWLFTIAKNTAFNYMRSKEYVETKKIKDVYEENQLGSILENPEEILQRKESMENLYELIFELPHKYKDLIILKYVEKLTYEEISNILSISVSKVESRLYMARQKLIENKCEKKNKGVKNLWNVKKQKNISIIMPMEK